MNYPKEMDNSIIKYCIKCSFSFCYPNIDNERLTPEAGTAIYHTFTVHKELFQGLD